MNFTFSRNVSLAVFAAFLLGGGLYLVNRQRHEALPQKRADKAKEAVSAEDRGRGPNGGDPGSQVAPIGPGRETVVAAAKRPNVFGRSGVVQLVDVPEGRFRIELSQLSETARRHALDQLEELRVPLNDVASLSADRDGWLFYQCHPRLPPPPVASLSEHNEALAGSLGAPEIVEAAAEVPLNAPPFRHSRPGATKVIYLDFNGHSISGSAWNNEKGNPGDANYRPAVATYVAKPFDADGNPNSFSDAEQAIIIRVWERVAEDYRGFDVDVTTEEPATFNANTGRILITDNVDANGVNMPSSTGSGVAYIDVFGRANYASYFSPALVYANQNYNYASYIAETASHEMGHNLSLSHDGTNSGDEYYNGHGTGETSWNTIMGGAFTENVTQWSKGEYYNANNTEDDLAIIAGHLGYVPDDHPDNNGSATPLAVSGLSVSGTGVISQTGEADRFSFESGAGAITLSATTFRSASQSYGGNLDVALELYDTGGSLVASANVEGVTNATLNTTVAGGTYYLRVLGAGSGLPLNNPPSGYTNYGSLGQYTISGTIVSTAPVAPSITSQPASVAVYTGQSVQFTVAASGYPAPSFQWRKGGVNIGGATGSSYSIPSAATGDAGSYTCVATNTAGTTTSNAASLTVTPATRPTFTTQPASQTILEGNSVAFVAAASGVPQPTFQWQKGGVNISGATGSSYTIASAAVTDGGSYAVVATNLAGSVTSNVADLTVNGPPVITFLNSTRQVLQPGQSLTLNTTTIGAGGVSYQWTHNGRPINGATSNTLTLNNTTRADSGYYLLDADNSYGRRRSVPVFVTVSPATTQLVSWFSSYLIPAGLNDVIAISGGGVVLKADGTVFDLNGGTGLGPIPSGLNNVVAVSAYDTGGGFGHALALKADGTIVAWGGYGASGVDIPAGLNNVVEISAGANHSVALKSDGTVVAWGQTFSGLINVPVGLTNVVSIAAGGNHTLALRADGTVVAWGSNSNWQLNVPAGLNNVTSIAAGNSHSLALKRDGTVLGWSTNFNGELSSLSSSTNIVAISAGNGYSLMLKNDGTAVGSGTGQVGTNMVPLPAGLTKVISFPREQSDSLALRDPNWVDQLPAFTSQPTSKTVDLGGSVTFSCSANGTPIPEFQWKKDGVSIVGANSNSYTIADVTVSDFGDYTVIASNYLGSVSSNVATLTRGTVPAGFDLASYLVRYPEVAAVYGANPYAAWLHYHDVGIYQGEVFDELFRVDEYLALYPELFALFGSDLGAALDHWLSTGRIEGKLGRIPLEFSAQGYFARNPDVATAVNNNPILAWGHYWLYGIYEGRAYDDELRVFEYLAINADLTAAFVNDWRTAALHWMRYGRTEGRLGRLPLTFSVATYLSRNPDVAAVWGTDPTTVFLHFWLYGINEARTYDDLFRVDDYLALNPDLAATFGTDRRGAFKHWVRYGQSEGRPGRIP